MVAILREMHSWFSSDLGEDPDGIAAAEWLPRRITSPVPRCSPRNGSRSEWDWPEEWRDASGSSDYLLELSASQLRELGKELTEVIERYRKLEAGPDPCPCHLLHLRLPSAGRADISPFPKRPGGSAAIPDTGRDEVVPHQPVHPRVHPSARWSVAFPSARSDLRPLGRDSSSSSSSCPPGAWPTRWVGSKS